MAVACDEALPITAVIAPDFTAEALVEAAGDYDPHYCIWREEQGFATLQAWLAENAR